MENKKQKIRDFAVRLGYALLPMLATLLVVAIVYAVGGIWNYSRHPYVISHEIYDCCLDAMITVLCGFFLGYWVLTTMMQWRKRKMMAYVNRLQAEAAELRRKIRAKELYEDISSLTPKEIYQRYHGWQTNVEKMDDGFISGYIAGYLGDLMVVVGYKHHLGASSYDELQTSFSLKNPNGMIADNDIEDGYESYDLVAKDCLSIFKIGNL